MYHETTIAGRCRVQLTCDRPNCDQMVTVFGDDHEDAQRQLLVRGWGLYKGKQQCPAHTREVAPWINGGDDGR